MPLHFLWTHSMHCEYRMDLLPTPLQQTAQGYLPDFWKVLRPTPETKDLVFFMFREPLLSMPAFPALGLGMHTSWVSVMSTRSSAWRSSHSPPEQNSRESTSSTRMKSSGLRTEPWCTPTPMPNPSLYWPLTRSKYWSSCPGWHTQPIPRPDAP